MLQVLGRNSLITFPDTYLPEPDTTLGVTGVVKCDGDGCDAGDGAQVDGDGCEVVQVAANVHDNGARVDGGALEDGAVDVGGTVDVDVRHGRHYSRWRSPA
ncbi:conserved hypothetical protein [Ricinus communis]|uniref:Uncharacterized protein n=1 Tax=Ricinus communis TaxID=3988 RepID=B9SEV8_RICCO|nr:conserved hypothetical protein [Ricinus communis]